MLKQRLVAAVGMVAVVAVMGFGCGGSDDSSGGSNNPLVGTWTAKMGADDPADPDVTVVVTFNADNTFSQTENGGAPETGTWATDGNKLTSSLGEAGDVMTYSVDGNTLTITVTKTEGDSGSIVFTRV